MQFIAISIQQSRGRDVTATVDHYRPGAGGLEHRYLLANRVIAAQGPEYSAVELLRALYAAIGEELASRARGPR